jgi:hypothetical protein
MAVKEKTEGNEETLEAAEVEWGTVDNELQLLQILCGTRPIGKEKRLKMTTIFYTCFTAGLICVKYLKHLFLFYRN